MQGMPSFKYKKTSDVNSSVTVLTNEVTIRGMLSMTFASPVYAVVFCGPCSEKVKVVAGNS